MQAYIHMYFKGVHFAKGFKHRNYYIVPVV